MLGASLDAFALALLLYLGFVPTPEQHFVAGIIYLAISGVFYIATIWARKHS